MVAENQDLGEPSGRAGGVGVLLREARVARGQDVAFVADALRIRQAYLEAIEEGRFEDLPGSTYAVGFVRGYAEYLGLDSKEIIRRFHQENGEFNGRAELVFPSAVSEGSIPTGALLGFTLIAVAAAYGAWYWYQSRDASVASTAPPLPERLAALINRPVGSGSELVPVGQADSSKVNEIPQPPPPAATPAVPTVTSSAPANPPVSSGGVIREDVVPPSEDDESSVPSPAPATGSAASATDAPPVTETKPVDPRPAEAKTAHDARARDSKAGVKPTEPPADAAVTPAAPQTADNSAPAVDIKADETRPTKEQKNKKARDAKAEQAKAAASGAEGTIPDGAAKPAEAVEGKPLSPMPSADSSPIPASAGTSGKGVVMTAQEDCWIQIRDASGKIVSKRLLRKGETYSAPHRPGLTMTVGNAGALNVVVDGKAIGSLGSLGMVRRDVSLDADHLKNGPEAPAGNENGATSGGSEGSTTPPPAPSGE
ncbi:RodZ domain-containing protein [Telmatospirillum sp.]|uniref:RodZ domain-containing protein n=1 Tax=Telmatospirillum sp. TaxID=2079197 RepID=UPI00284A1EF6|nr:RodZ domain-containing protein [Telmatospirillum sp.]MDR3438582.1 DUF4115 domain-containing protein [Telmatospirillum sp.]